MQFNIEFSLGDNGETVIARCSGYNKKDFYFKEDKIKTTTNKE